MREFTGKVTVVTGGANGTGYAFAKRFAWEGMRVVLADVDEAAPRAVESDLRGAGHDALGVRPDVLGWKASSNSRYNA